MKLFHYADAGYMILDTGIWVLEVFRFNLLWNSAFPVSSNDHPPASSIEDRPILTGEVGQAILFVCNIECNYRVKPESLGFSALYPTYDFL